MRVRVRRMRGEAGIHYGMSFSEYRELKAVNITTLCAGFASAEHLKAALDGKLRKDSRAMAFGRALHARLLEPAIYRERFALGPRCMATLGSGKRKGQACGAPATWRLRDGWFCGKHQAGEQVSDVLTAEEASRVEAAAEAVKRHDVVKLLRQRGGYEATVLAEIDGYRVMGRMDKYIPANEHLPATIVDLKKVQVGRATMEAVERAVWEYHYDVKAAWYCRLVELVTGVEPEFVWVFVEDDEPYGVNVVQCDADTKRVGRVRLRKVWGMYVRGMETGEWPGYTRQIRFGGVPEWAKRQMLG